MKFKDLGQFSNFSKKINISSNSTTPLKESENIFNRNNFQAESTPLNIAFDFLPKNIYNDFNDEKGQYGSSQMAFRENNAELLQDVKIQEIIRSYFPEATLEDMEMLMYSLCNVGCGYAAIVNSIFAHYATLGENAFYETFGFPMYKLESDGTADYNYEYLILDLYCYRHKDETGWDGSKWLSPLEIAIEHPEAYTDFLSVDMSYVNEWLAEKDISANVTLDTYTINQVLYDNYYFDGLYWSSDFYNNLKSYLADPSKEVIINTGESTFSNSPSSWELYDMDGELYCSMTSGHAMSVIDVLENGDLIVSSWGKKYRLHTENPEEVYKGITVVDFSS